MVIISPPNILNGRSYLYSFKYSPNGRYLLICGTFKINDNRSNSHHGIILIDFVLQTNRKLEFCYENDIFLYWISNSEFVVTSSCLKKDGQSLDNYQISESNDVTLKEQINYLSTVSSLGRVAPCGTEYLNIANCEYILDSIENADDIGFMLNIQPKYSNGVKEMLKKSIFLHKEFLTNYPGARLYDWTALSIRTKLVFPMIEESTEYLFFICIDLTKGFSGTDQMDIIAEVIKIPQIPTGHICIGNFSEDADYITFCTKYNNCYYANVVLKETYMFGISFASYMFSLTEEQQTLILLQVTIHPSGKIVIMLLDPRSFNITIEEISITHKKELQSLRSIALSAAVYNLFKKPYATEVDFSMLYLSQ